MENHEKKSDEELVKCSLKDEDCFYYLIKRYELKILRYINRMTKVSQQEIEDILQEIFLKVYLNLNGFDQKLKFSSWIYRIARNEIINNYYKNRISSGMVRLGTDKDVNILAGLISDDAHVKYTSLDSARQVRKALNKLPAKYRDVLVLRFLEEKSYNEISDILRMPSGTVATLINRAKVKFKKVAQHYHLDSEV